MSAVPTWAALSVAWLFISWPLVPAFTRAWKRKRTSALGARLASRSCTVVPESVPASASAASVTAVKAAPLTLYCIVPAT